MFVVFIVLACVSLRFAAGADEAMGTDDPARELDALVTRIQQKLELAPPNKEALAGDIAEFDALLAKYRDRKTEDVARILFMKAALFIEVFDDTATGLKLLKQLQAEFPGSQAAAQVDEAVKNMQRRIEAEQAQVALIGQPAPALHFEWASREGLASLDDLNGKIVVLDFWATWCGPCVASFPKLRELVTHYAGQPVEFVGVTSLQGRIDGLEPDVIDTRGASEKEHQLMADYIKAQDITWTVAFSREDVFNPEYGVVGIPSMAIVAPDGKVRHAGLHPAMSHDEKVQMIDALLDEFGLKRASAN